MFKVTIPPIELDNVTHDSTDWEVYTDKALTDRVFESYGDTVNKNEIIIDLDVREDTIYYVRYRLNFSDGTKTYWSRPIIATKNIDGISTNNIIVVTPKIMLDGNEREMPLGGFTIETSEFMLFLGNGNHESTDWVIEDINGNRVWERLKDRSNLTKIKVPSDILKPNKSYVIKVRYRTDNNGLSNWGKKYINTIVLDYVGDIVMGDELEAMLTSLTAHLMAVENAVVQLNTN